MPLEKLAASVPIFIIEPLITIALELLVMPDPQLFVEAN